MNQLKELAIIDIGSNTVRLVIYQVSPMGNISQLQNVKLPIRLYQYLDEQKRLSKVGVQALIEVIGLFQSIISQYEVDELLATATAVLRQANNQKDVIESVKKQTGLKLRLLSEKEESYYGQYAIARTTQFSEGYTIDMGGGSTEVTYFKENKIVKSHSFPFGVVTLKNLFFKDKPHNDRKAMKRTQEYVMSQFQTQEWLRARALPIIAVGGSARNIASVHQILCDYPLSGIHEYEMDGTKLEETKELFEVSTIEELQSLDGLSKDRVDIILPANLTFSSLLELVDAPAFIFCNKGLREGLLLERLNQDRPHLYDPDKVIEGVMDRMTETYDIVLLDAAKRMEVSKQLLTICEEHQLVESTKTLEKYLYYASFLYHVGAYIEEDDSSMHSFYLIANSNLNGFSHKQRVTLALLAGYKNKSLMKKFLKQFPGWFSEDEVKLIRYAGCFIKFTEALMVTRVNHILSMSFENVTKKSLTLKIVWQNNPLAETYRANRQKKNLETVLNKSITLDFY